MKPKIFIHFKHLGEQVSPGDASSRADTSSGFYLTQITHNSFNSYNSFQLNLTQHEKNNTSILTTYHRLVTAL